MKLLTKQTDYAIRALGYLATHTGRFISSTEIAGTEHIPASFLRRVMQKLIKEGVVTAREGKNGGIQLAVQPGTIRVIELMELFQGKVELSECMVGKDICPKRPSCMLRKKILQTEQRLIEEISKLCLADLL